MKIALIAALGLTLFGCAGPPLDQSLLQEAREPLICSDKAQCDLYWQRAQIYLAKYSGWKIQTTSDVVLQTYGPLSADVRSAYSLTKEPLGDGRSRIAMTIGCGNIYRCDPSIDEAALRLKRYVKAGAP